MAYQYVVENIVDMCSFIDMIPSQGVPNMPEKVMMGLVRDDGSKSCLPGVVTSVPLPGCLPMDFDTW